MKMNKESIQMVSLLYKRKGLEVQQYTNYMLLGQTKTKRLRQYQRIKAPAFLYLLSNIWTISYTISSEYSNFMQNHSKTDGFCMNSGDKLVKTKKNHQNCTICWFDDQHLTWLYSTIEIKFKI